MTDSLTSKPMPYGFELWKHLHDEHGLTLTESELNEIVRLAVPPTADRICDDELKITYEHGQPYGIRDRGGYLFFFSKISKYSGQEERYRDEVAQAYKLADFLLRSLQRVAVTKTVTPEQFVQNVANVPDTPWSTPTTPPASDAEKILMFIYNDQFTSLSREAFQRCFDYYQQHRAAETKASCNCPAKPGEACPLTVNECRLRADKIERERTAHETSVAPWRCSVCNNMNPDDATHCRQCEYSRTVMRDGKPVDRTGPY